MATKSKIISLLLICLFLTGSLVGAQSLTTLFAGNNGGSAGGNVLFNLTVKNAKGLMITQLDVNCNYATTSPICNLTIYTAPNTYIGKESTIAPWTKVSTGSGTAMPVDTPTVVKITPFYLPMGTHAIAITNSAGNKYTNGTGSNQNYSNADLAFVAGAATNIPFTGSPFSIRVANIRIHYGANKMAAFGVFGTGCKGTNGIPIIAPQPGSVPKLGAVLKVDITNMPTSPGAILVLNGFRTNSFGGLTLPFDLSGIGFTGCDLLVNIIWTGGSANLGTGPALYTMSIPNNQLLLGGIFFCQAIIMDKGANPGGFTFTNGGAGFIGQ